MYISKVHIENFRNIPKLGVFLSAGLNVIVGENNIGKTNLLDAIRVALAAGTPAEQVRLTHEDRFRRPDGTFVGSPIRVELVFAGLSEQDRVEMLEILTLDPTNPAASTASIQYEWVWSEKTNRYGTRRVSRPDSESFVPEDVLQALPVTLLHALRDAQTALAPGRRSRLGQLLSASASDVEKEGIQEIVRAANEALEKDTLIRTVEKQIADVLLSASGPHLSQKAAIRASEPAFERIASNLRLMLKEDGPDGDVLSDLRTNGLGYNNLLFIATVLAELEAAKEAVMPLLLVEEPEAHLHPQLQTLLADFLARGGTTGPHGSKVQTIVTTHSPTIAAHVDPRLIRVLHRTKEGPRCVAVNSCGLSDPESKQLRRMLDVTKATLLFSRGVILVEGISEALLVPVLARRLGRNLEQAGVSVIPIAGVSFSTLAKLFGKGKLQIPLAIVTDADPTHDYVPPDSKDPQAASPRQVGSEFEKCSRLTKLLSEFSSDETIRVFYSSVTLEFDLAAAAARNGLTIFDAWVSCYPGRKPKLLTRELLESKASPTERALLIWRAVCVADPAHGKAELAHALADRLEARAADGGQVVPEFVVPKYLQDAITHALGP